MFHSVFLLVSIKTYLSKTNYIFGKRVEFSITLYICIFICTNVLPKTNEYKFFVITSLEIYMYYNNTGKNKLEMKKDSDRKQSSF
jgi:hypothetical protein